jgi:hypothetical protein
MADVIFNEEVRARLRAYDESRPHRVAPLRRYLPEEARDEGKAEEAMQQLCRVAAELTLQHKPLPGLRVCNKTLEQ